VHTCRTARAAGRQRQYLSFCTIKASQLRVYLHCKNRVLFLVLLARYHNQHACVCGGGRGREGGGGHREVP
jgi:hypothetical protein